MNEQRVSSRYAEALFDIAKENKSSEKVLEDLNFIEHTLNESKELSSIIFSPIIPEDKKIEISKEIFSDSITKITLKFLVLLTQKGRENLIFDIKTEFIKLYNIEFNIQPVEIITAYEIDTHSSENISANLHKLIGKTISPVYKIDKSLKGGIKIRINDIIYDYSIQSQLNQLKNKLVKN